jgi:hypothetical protein
MNPIVLDGMEIRQHLRVGLRLIHPLLPPGPQPRLKAYYACWHPRDGPEKARMRGEWTEAYQQEEGHAFFKRGKAERGRWKGGKE